MIHISIIGFNLLVAIKAFSKLLKRILIRIRAVNNATSRRSRRSICYYFPLLLQSSRVYATSPLNPSIVANSLVSLGIVAAVVEEGGGASGPSTPAWSSSSSSSSGVFMLLSSSSTARAIAPRESTAS
jgi:hypothetical protein